MFLYIGFTLNNNYKIWTIFIANYIKSSLESFSGSVYYSNNPWSWTSENWDYNCYSWITCTDVWISQNQNEGLNANWNPFDTDLPILVINQWIIYVNKDNFFYMLVTSAVVLLLFRSVIFILLISFKTWKNLASWKGFRIKK